MKILIVGILGSGKSTLAYELSRHFSLPRLNLDEVSRDPQTGVYRTDEEASQLIDNFIHCHPHWIAEGCQQKLYTRLMPNLIIYTNVSYLKAAYRFTLRFFKARQLIGKPIDPRLPVQPYHYRCPTPSKILSWNRCNHNLNREINNYLKTATAPIICIKSRRDFPALFSWLELNRDISD